MEERERGQTNTSTWRSGNDPVMGAERDHNSDQRNHNSMGLCGKRGERGLPTPMRSPLPSAIRNSEPCLVISDRISRGRSHGSN